MPVSKDTKRNLFYAGLILATIPMAGCNTIDGAGEDIESVGDAVEDGTDELGEDGGN
jgi:predicted small secreted protein